LFRRKKQKKVGGKVQSRRPKKSGHPGEIPQKAKNTKTTSEKVQTRVEKGKVKKNRMLGGHALKREGVSLLVLRKRLSWRRRGSSRGGKRETQQKAHKAIALTTQGWESQEAKKKIKKRLKLDVTELGHGKKKIPTREL